MENRNMTGIEEMAALIKSAIEDFKRSADGKEISEWAAGTLATMERLHVHAVKFAEMERAEKAQKPTEKWVRSIDPETGAVCHKLQQNNTPAPSKADELVRRLRYILEVEPGGTTLDTLEKIGKELRDYEEGK